MTDKEIMQVLDCCKRTYLGHCQPCPLYKNMSFRNGKCLDVKDKEALDLINRQQAEIDRLTNYNRCIDAQCRDLLDKEEKAKAKVIKEFKCKLIEQIEYIGEAHQAEYKDDFGKGWMAGFNTAAHLITGAIGYIAGFENRGANNG